METIKEYIKLLLVEYDLDEQELLDIWAKAHPVVETLLVEVEPIPPTELVDGDEKLLKAMKKPALQAMCKERKLSQVGNKMDLINRLLKREQPKVSKEKKTKTPKEKAPKASKAVLNTLVAKTLNVRRNDFGNYEDADTGFVFDAQTKIVIGKQNPTGSIDDLTVADVEKCIELKYSYRLPINLEE